MVGCAEDMWRLDPSENKAKSVQIQLNLPVGTELGNNKLTKVVFTFKFNIFW